jgi:hypothetical protein
MSRWMKMVISALADHRMEPKNLLANVPLDPTTRDLAFCTANGTSLE